MIANFFLSCIQQFHPIIKIILKFAGTLFQYLMAEYVAYEFAALFLCRQQDYVGTSLIF